MFRDKRRRSVLPPESARKRVKLERLSDEEDLHAASRVEGMDVLVPGASSVKKQPRDLKAQEPRPPVKQRQGKKGPSAPVVKPEIDEFPITQCSDLPARVLRVYRRLHAVVVEKSADPAGFPEALRPETPKLMSYINESLQEAPSRKWPIKNLGPFSKSRGNRAYRNPDHKKEYGETFTSRLNKMDSHPEWWSMSAGDLRTDTRQFLKDKWAREKQTKPKKKRKKADPMNQTEALRGIKTKAKSDFKTARRNWRSLSRQLDWNLEEDTKPPGHEELVKECSEAKKALQNARKAYKSVRKDYKKALTRRNNERDRKERKRLESVVDITWTTFKKRPVPFVAVATSPQNPAIEGARIEIKAEAKNNSAVNWFDGWRLVGVETKNRKQQLCDSLSLKAIREMLEKAPLPLKIGVTMTPRPHNMPKPAGLNKGDPNEQLSETEQELTSSSDECSDNDSNVDESNIIEFDDNPLEDDFFNEEF